MYTAHFVHENKSYSIRRVRCTDGTLRALATDIFRAVNSSNITLYLRQYQNIPKVYQCVHKDVITANKKEFHTNVRETRTMTQEQVLTVLGRMRAHSLTVAFKQWIIDHFYDDVVRVTEEEGKKEEVEENENKTREEEEEKDEAHETR